MKSAQGHQLAGKFRSSDTSPSTADEFFFIGPTISSAIVDASPDNNQSTPCYFLTAPSVVSFIGLLLFVDLEQSRWEQEEFLEEERRVRQTLAIELQ